MLINIFLQVAHNSIVIYPDNSFGMITNQLNEIDYSYETCIKFDCYHHTSSLMFRKLVKELPEAFSTQKSLRGDSACFYFHAFTSKQVVKFLPDISSCYNFNKQGLWSGITSEEKYDLTHDFYNT